jgi:hypothetical protein
MDIVLGCLYLAAVAVTMGMAVRLKGASVGPGLLAAVFLVCAGEELQWGLPWLLDANTLPTTTLTGATALAYQGVSGPVDLSTLGVVAFGRLIALVAVVYGGSFIYLRRKSLAAALAAIPTRLVLSLTVLLAALTAAIILQVMLPYIAPTYLTIIRLIGVVAGWGVVISLWSRPQGDKPVLIVTT